MKFVSRSAVNIPEPGFTLNRAELMNTVNFWLGKTDTQFAEEQNLRMSVSTLSIFSSFMEPTTYKILKASIPINRRGINQGNRGTGKPGPWCGPEI